MGLERSGKAWQMRSIQTWAFSAIRRLNTPRDKQAQLTIAAGLLVFEAVLCTLIVCRVPYTEIDWSTYMQQVKIFLQGERDYSAIEGSTGPVVYPAGFLYVYSALYRLTNYGQIAQAQVIFALLYLMNQAVVIGLYIRSEAVPPVALLLLCLSKRLHSIFMLRLFNDCVAVFISNLAIWLLLDRRWRLSLLAFSVAVSVKMNILLLAPPVLVIVMQGSDMGSVIEGAVLGVLWQLLLGAPFLLKAPGSYISRSFDFSRVFLYKWSVNLKFLPEDVFLSRETAALLLAGHLGLLWIFAQKRWCRDSGGILQLVKRFLLTSNEGRGKAGGKQKMQAYGPDKVLLIVFTGTLIGILCARSLHYQFYCWYFHMLPFLLWQVEMHSIVRCGLLLIIEVCWNIFPSTAVSSGWLMACHICILIGLWSFPQYHAQPKGSLLRQQQAGRKMRTQ